MKTFINDFLKSGISKIVIIISGVLTSIITARYLGPEKNGIISSILVFPSLFMSIGSLGIQQATTYFVGKKMYSDEIIKRAITQIWFFTSILSFIVCFFLVLAISNYHGSYLLIILAILPIPFTLFNTYNSGFFLGKNDLKEFNKINWVPSLICLLFSFILLVIFPLEIKGYLIALIIGPIFMSIILANKLKFFHSFNFIFDWVLIKKMLSLGGVYAIALLAINLNYRFDVIMLDNLSTSYEVGIYTKGANIIQFLWQIPMLLSTIVFTRSAISKNDKLFSLKVAQLLRLSFIVISIFSIVLFFISDFLIVLMFGKFFYASSIVLKNLIPGVVLMTVFKVLNMDLAGKGMPWISLKAMVPSLIINICINYVLIPIYGANGAAISSTISYAFASFLFLYFYSKAVNIPIMTIVTLKKEDIFIFKKLLKISKV